MRSATVRLAAVAAGLCALVACGGSSPSMLDPHGSESRSIAGTWWLMFGMAAVVYVVVAGLIVYAIVRGRRRSPRLRTFSDDGVIWVGGIIVPIVILGVLAIVTVTTTMELRPVRAGAVRVEVIGKRWWWDVRYPDGGFRTADEIHLPVGRPVDLVLRSDDVVHSFWVPQLAGKVDMIPGQTNHLRFTPDQLGTFRGQCAEFCGLDHALMSFTVVVEPASTFDRWVTRRHAASTGPSTELGGAGEQVFMREACAGCHTIRDTEAVGRVGPDLTDFGTRASIAANTVPNTTAHLRDWITDPQGIKTGSLMPPTRLSRRDLDALVAYLEQLG